MKSCFLFGHRDVPPKLLPDLVRAIEQEVSQGIKVFYVGYHGRFDFLAAAALRTVKQKHKEISLVLLLAYHPAERAVKTPAGFDGTFYPPLESVPHRFALVRANQYMVRTADSIICYAKYPGNSMELWKLASRRAGNLRVYNLAEAD